MKRIVSILFYLLMNMAIHAQSQYDYMDDSAVTGSIDKALYVFLITFFFITVLVIIVFILGVIDKIRYEFSPQKELDRLKREKEEREQQEKIRKEQERQKALLALPENKVRLLVRGRPHIVELASLANKIRTEMLAICLRNINKIVWDGTDITAQVGFIDKNLSRFYSGHYITQSWAGIPMPMDQLIVSRRCTELADETSSVSFEIEFTIRGDFTPKKLQFIHHMHEGLSYDNICRDIKCLEFILYDGDTIQTHQVNGKPLCFPYKGFCSFPKF